jgi:hypothetical protein
MELVVLPLLLLLLLDMIMLAASVTRSITKLAACTAQAQHNITMLAIEQWHINATSKAMSKLLHASSKTNGHESTVYRAQPAGMHA